MISKELEDRISQSRKGREERFRETRIVGKSQGTQTYKVGRLGGYLHLRGPGCVVLMFYTEQKKANCTFFIVRKGKVVLILTLRDVYKGRSQPGTELKWLYLLCFHEKQSKRNRREKLLNNKERE